MTDTSHPCQRYIDARNALALDNDTLRAQLAEAVALLRDCRSALKHDDPASMDSTMDKANAYAAAAAFLARVDGAR